MISGKGRKQKAENKSPSNFEGVSPQGDGVVYIDKFPFYLILRSKIGVVYIKYLRKSV